MIRNDDKKNRGFVVWKNRSLDPRSPNARRTEREEWTEVAGGGRGASWFVLGDRVLGLDLILVLLLQRLLENALGQPETLLEEVDKRLAEVLPRGLAADEVALIWIDL